MSGSETEGKPPFMFVRAMLVMVPLAILAGTVVAPPDPIGQLIMIGGTLLGGMPIAYRLVGDRRYGPKQIGAFFGVVLFGTLFGLIALQRVGSGPIPETLLRFLIVLASLVAADVAVFRLIGMDEG